MKKTNETSTSQNRIDDFIVYTWSRDLDSDFILKDCIFGGVKFAKNADSDKFLTVIWVKMSLFLVLIWADLCILTIRKKDILILGEGQE